MVKMKSQRNLVKLAQTGKGITVKIKDGEILKIFGMMPKAEGGYLKIGVQLFRKNGSKSWEMTTILTRQVTKKLS